jgi:hypothetical protein
VRVFENRVLRRTFRPSRVGVTGAGEDCIMMSFIRMLLTTYYQDNQIKGDNMREKRNVYKILV